MIIIEGMDGTGKTGLVNRLSTDLMIPVHKRAATSIGGPVSRLYEWVEDDVKTLGWQPFSVYDRHPLVSEFIYGPIVRQSMDPRFHTLDGQGNSVLFWNSVLIVFCDPGIEEVRRNVLAAEHMGGVSEHWEQLYWAYKSLMHYWPGQVVVWDYRYPQLYPSLRSQCVEFMSLRKGPNQ